MSGEAEHEIYQRRKGRIAATGLVLGVLALLIFAVTIVKLQSNATSPFAELFNPAIEQPDQQ